MALAGAVPEITDGELLEDFVVGREEARVKAIQSPQKRSST